MSFGERRNSQANPPGACTVRHRGGEVDCLSALSTWRWTICVRYAPVWCCVVASALLRQGALCSATVAFLASRRS
jgi:hypothetical protein